MGMEGSGEGVGGGGGGGGGPAGPADEADGGAKAPGGLE